MTPLHGKLAGMANDSNTCSYWMKIAKEPCGLKSGHNDSHRTAAAVARAREASRELKRSKTPPDRRRKYHREYWRMNRSRMARLKSRYRLTQARFAQLLALQDWSCGVCRVLLDSIPVNKIHIDHDHACCGHPGALCGRCTRGIVCASCNARIGQYEAGEYAAGGYPASITEAIERYLADPPAQRLPRRTVLVRAG